ncbi:MAG: hypothetical protein DRH24_20420 [Deltaproteobacteria bacterium]|nr:MAG: hypothetical protein DRH24_20420 [Deltaproteobacteria bacterium]
MTKTIGTVISTFEGPSTSQFSFVIKEDSGTTPVQKGQFIQVKTEQGILIGRVDESSRPIVTSCKQNLLENMKDQENL